MPKLTLDEIAALAGVSRSTVSRALNNQPRVSVEVRERVQRIMATTGYAPNTAAQLLAQRQRLPLVAVVINEPTETLFSDPELGRIMTEVSEACRLNHCLCALYLLNGLEQLPALRPTHVIGAVAIGAQSARIGSELHARQLPVIVIDRFNPPDRTDLAAAIKQFFQPRLVNSA